MLSRRTALGIAFPLCVLMSAGCGGAPDAQPAGTPASSSSPQPVANPVSSAIAIGSPSPVAATATIDVSPAEQRVGAISMSLSFEPPRHMLDQLMALSPTNVDPAQPTPMLPDGVSKGAFVLNDMLHVTNNMDPTQPVPADSAQAIVRHVVLQVRTGDAAQPLPYLGVTLDMLLDGHPVTFGQTVVPMVAAEALSPAFYYGNNVRLGQRGMYQVFVRLSHNALLGNDQPQAAQFNVRVR